MSEANQEVLDAIETGDIAGMLTAPLSAEEIDALVEKAGTDPGAPFESHILARIAATKRADLATFIRLRERLKAEIGIAELDKALSPLEAASGGKDSGEQGRAINFPEIEPWPVFVDGATLLHLIVVEIQRYVTMSPEAAAAVALWIVHAYCFDLFTISPRLVITSPEKRCGKTTLLRVVEALVPKALAAANITAAAMFRTIEKYRPTLSIDEADTFLRDNEELRGVINSGHEREGQVVRLVGEDFEPRAFSTYCPTAIAAIGSLPGTIEDRAIVITMRRRLATEPVERFRSDRANHLHELRRKVARWVADNEQALRVADPNMPTELHDRACDNWRPLLAIADLAGWDWPQMARMAAQALSAQGSEQDGQSRGVMLLADIRRVFEALHEKRGKDTDRVSSTGLVNALLALTDRPWGAWSGGKPITAAAVARRLKDFVIRPTTIKLSDGDQPNGYKLSQFKDAFDRYLPQSPASPAGSSPGSPTSAKSMGSGQNQGSPRWATGEVFVSAESQGKQGVGEDGELSIPQMGNQEQSDRREDLDVVALEHLEEIVSQEGFTNLACAGLSPLEALRTNSAELAAAMSVSGIGRQRS